MHSVRVNEDPPFLSVHQLFVHYNRRHFEDRLDGTSVEWSDRMTLCAGICYLRRQAAARYCVIRLSRPLLQYRPFADTRSTLLHEMIHAYLWITARESQAAIERHGHGADFLHLARRINAAEAGDGVQVTVFHQFHAEVQEARRHVWRCNGPCQRQPPFFGLVRRAMNRAPQPADRWWRAHQARCGGTFVKISDPTVSGQSSPGDGPAAASTPWRGTPRLARDACSNSQMRQCPACRSHLASDQAALWKHLDQCVGATGGSHPPPVVYTCPVCGIFTAAGSPEALNDHLDACLGSDAPLDSREIIDLT